jgi:hypothetical protein
MEQAGRCRLLALVPLGQRRVQMLCAGDESWLARGGGASLKLRKLHAFIRGYGYSHAFRRKGKMESVRGFDQKIRHIVIDSKGEVAVRDWPSAGGSLVAAAAGPGGVTDRVPIKWSRSTALLAVTSEPGRAAFVVRDDSGIQVIHKAPQGEWVAVHVGKTAPVAASTCAADLQAYLKAPGRESCTRRGHRVEVAAIVRRGASLWLVLGTHRYERRIHQRVEGGGIASALRGDMLASRDRVELWLVKIVAGSTSGPSWRVAAAQSVDLRCDDPGSACHALDDLAAVRLAIADNVMHVAAQSSERMLHFAVELGRRRSGAGAVALTRTLLRERPQDVTDPQEVTEPAEVARAPKPDVHARPPQAPQCEAGQTRCAERLCADLRSDVGNCGACGHQCVSGRCNRGRCAPVCHRDSDCNPRSKTPGAGHAVGLKLICLTPGRTFGGARPRGCAHSGCQGDTTCSKVTGKCVPRACRRRSDCGVPGSICAAPDGQRARRCLPPGHCGSIPLVPRSRGR